MTMTGPELLGSRNRMEDITLEKLDKSDLKAVLVKVYDHNRFVRLTRLCSLRQAAIVAILGCFLSLTDLFKM